MTKHYYEPTDLDRILRKTVREREESDKNIDLDSAWDAYQKRYGIARTGKRTVRYAIALCSFVLVFALVLSSPTVSSALNIKFFETAKSFLIGKVQSLSFSFSTTPNQVDIMELIEPDIRDTLASVPFPVLLPVEMLGIFFIDGIVVEDASPWYVVKLYLSKPDAESVVITQLNIVGDFRSDLAYDTEDAQVRQVRIRGQDTVLIKYKDGTTVLRWVDQDIFIEISGPLSEDDIMIMANSMRTVDY